MEEKKEWGRDGRARSEERGRRDGGNHGYKAKKVMHRWVRAVRMDTTVWEGSLPAVRGAVVCYGSVCWQDLLRQGESVPPFAAKSRDEEQLSHSFQGGGERERMRGKRIREVKMAAWCELWSVYPFPHPVSPQPPLSVLPQPVVFQSIGSQLSSHRACALPGLWRKQLSPPPSLPPSLNAFFLHYFLPLSLPPPSLH